jgi:hypothetical protein
LIIETEMIGGEFFAVKDTSIERFTDGRYARVAWLYDNDYQYVARLRYLDSEETSIVLADGTEITEGGEEE